MNNVITATRFLVTEGDTTIEAYAWGTGPAIVLLPSLARGAEDFQVIAPYLAAAGYRVIAPEPRGIGASRGRMEGVTLHDVAADIARVIQRAASGPVLVAGHAYGNWVARTLAVDRPDLVRAVALLAAGKKGPTAPDISQSITTSIQASAAEDERIAALAHAFFAPGNDPRVWLAGWHPAVGSMERAASKAVPQDLIWTAGGVVPVLEVQAADDVLLPPEYRGQLCELLGASRVTTVLVTRAGHALLPEQPAAVVRALLDFCGQVGH